MPPKLQYGYRSSRAATSKRQTKLVFDPLDEVNSRSSVEKGGGGGFSPANVRYEVLGGRRLRRDSGIGGGVEDEGNQETIVILGGLEGRDENLEDRELEDELVGGGSGSGSKNLLNRTLKRDVHGKEKGQVQLGSARSSTRSRSEQQVVLAPGKPVDVSGGKSSDFESSFPRPRINTKSGTRRSTRSSNIKDLIMAKHPRTTSLAARKESPDSSEGSLPEDEIQAPSKWIKWKGKGKDVQSARENRLNVSDGSSPEDEIQTPLKQMKGKGIALKSSQNMKDEDASLFIARTYTSEDPELDLPSTSAGSNTRPSSASKAKRKYTPTKRRLEVSSSFSDDNSFEDIRFHLSAVNKAGSQRQRLRYKGKKNKVVSLEDSDDKEWVVANSQRRAKGNKKKLISLLDSDEDEEQPIMASSQKCEKSTKKMAIPSGDSDEDEEQPIVSSSQRRLKKLVIDDSDNDDLPARRRSSGRKTARRGTTDSETIEADDVSDEIVTASARSRRGIVSSQLSACKQPPLMSPLKRCKEAADDSDSDIAITSLFKRRRHQQAQIADEAGHSGSDDESIRPFQNPTRSSTHGGSRSSTGTPARTTRQQVKAWRHRTPKEKQKELLRRRRQGEKIEQVTDSETPSEDEEDEREELKVLEAFPDDDEESQQRRGSVKGTATPAHGIDDDEEAFIVHDDDHTFGVEAEQMPLEFTHAAFKRVRDHFKDVVEWLVQCKINPSFNRNDPLYRTASLKVDDVSRGYASSQLVSSAWTAEFTRAVYARPYFQATSLPKTERFNERGEVKCDACNHRSHTPTYVIEFWGKPYYKDSLEDITKDGDEEEPEVEEHEEEEEEDRASVNTQGQDLPDHQRKWYTGVNCKSKADLAHTLIHWKFRLNSCVLDQLSEDNHLTSAAAAARRENMSRDERSREVFAIVDGWERAKTVKAWYEDFKRVIDDAKAETEKGGGRWA